MSKQTTHNAPVSSLATAAQGKLPKLTRKQQAFVTHILENPKDSNTKAAQIAYPSVTQRSAEQIAYENLKKPEIIMALGKANNMVEQVLIQTVDQYKDSDKQWERTLANDNAKWIHDKLHGKAKQQIDVNSTSVTLNIDLTGNGQPHTD